MASPLPINRWPSLVGLLRMAQRFASLATFLEALTRRFCLGRAFAGLVRLVAAGIAMIGLAGLWTLGEPLGDTSASGLSFGGH
ncbi:MAG: hypothetical protein CMJ63_03920 [Planctomycetaceae bacterium]|nr:hypothetical protein [Planctomycetaceae bacterium]